MKDRRVCRLELRRQRWAQVQIDRVMGLVAAMMVWALVWVAFWVAFWGIVS